LEETVRLTREALRTRKPLFEAAFAANGAYCRTDILAPAPNDAWDVIEVKSTTSVKDVHLHDLAFQTWVLAQAGLTVRRCLLLHINPDFVRHGPVDSKRFFVAVELTDQVSNLTRTVEDALDDQFKVIRQTQHPEVRIGPHCGDPYPCPLQNRCWGFLPKHSVLDLYRGTKKGFGLLDQGVTLLKDIPDDTKLTASQAIQKATAISGQPHVNQHALEEFLSGLEYPVHFLDFETFGTAIPLFHHAALSANPVSVRRRGEAEGQARFGRGRSARNRTRPQKVSQTYLRRSLPTSPRAHPVGRNARQGAEDQGPQDDR